MSGWTIKQWPEVLSLSHAEAVVVLVSDEPSSSQWRWQFKSWGPAGSPPNLVRVWLVDERFEHLHIVSEGESAVDVSLVVSRAAQERGLPMSRGRQRELEDALVESGLVVYRPRVEEG
jgi:hypothetical protein